MTEQLVDFETAKLAREKGFDWKSRYIWMWKDEKQTEVNPPGDEEMIAQFNVLVLRYRNNIDLLIKNLVGLPSHVHPLRNSGLPKNFFTRPTQNLLDRYLREGHHLAIVVHPTIYGGWTFKIMFLKDGVPNEYGVNYITSKVTGPIFTYEQAMEIALQEALKLLPDDPTYNPGK